MDHLSLHDYTYPHAMSPFPNGQETSQTTPSADTASASLLNAGHMQRSTPFGYLAPGRGEQAHELIGDGQQQLTDLLELLQAEVSKSKVLGSQLSRMTAAQSHAQVGMSGFLGE